MDKTRALRPVPKPLLLVAIAIVSTLMLAACSSSSKSATDSGTPGKGTGTAPASKVDPAIRDLLPDAIKSSNTIQFGALWETPPTVYVDQNNPSVPIGIAPGLAAQMGEILGVTIKWQNLQWPAQLPGLQAGSVDVLFGQVSITADREKNIVDLIPFQKHGYALLVAAGNPHKIATPTDLCGLTVGVPIGSNTGQMMKDISQKDCVGAGRKAMKFNDYNGATAAVQALRAGTIDSWFDTSASVAAIAASDKATYSWVAVPESVMSPQYTALAVSKENPKLTAALVAALKKVIAGGGYAKVYASVPGGDTMMLTEAMIVPNPLTHTPVGQKAGS